MALFNWLFRRDAPSTDLDQDRREPQAAQPQLRVSAAPALIRGHALELPTGDFRFIALDVETACSDAASICQIGLACVLPDNRIRTYSTLVNPDTRFDHFNIQLHGIGPDHVVGAPRFDETFEHLFPLLSRHHLVQHSSFDKQAMNAACRSCGIEPPDFRWADSVKIARRAWPELKGNGGHGLANLKKVLDLEFRHHDASEDARAAAMVVLHAEMHLRMPFDDLIKPARKQRYPAPFTRDGDPSGAMAGSVVVFTGALGMSRTDAAELAARIGMTVQAGVTKQTTHLVVGDHDLTVLAGQDPETAGEDGAVEGEDDVPEPPATPVSVPGDLWQLGNHWLICGDSTSADVVGRLLGDVIPLLMVTDPPYGVEYDPGWRNQAGAAKTKRTGKVLNDDRADWREAWALFPGDVAYVWHGALHATTVAESLTVAGFAIRSQIIWAKDRLVLSRGDYHWQHEPCWYAVRTRGKGHWAGDRKQTTLWSIANKDQDAETVHGTQKPVECMRRPILNNSNPGQAIYEPFMGSGTTLIAAETTGRVCFGVELNPAYVDVAVERWQTFTGKEAVHAETGETFTAVKAKRLVP